GAPRLRALLAGRAASGLAPALGRGRDPGCHDLRRAGAPRRLARADDRRRLRADEPGHGPDVGRLRDLLLDRALPGGDAAVRPGAAADLAERRAARRDARRRRDDAARAEARSARALGRDLLLRRAEALPLAVGALLPAQDALPSAGPRARPASVSD